MPGGGKYRFGRPSREAPLSTRYDARIGSVLLLVARCAIRRTNDAACSINSRDNCFVRMSVPRRMIPSLTSTVG